MSAGGVFHVDTLDRPWMRVGSVTCGPAGGGGEGGVGGWRTGR